MNGREIPKTIGRYVIEGILGEGAMSVVYAGFDPDIQRKVAIKCLHQEVAADPAYRRRFVAEARAAGHLTHPHILTIFDAGESEDGYSYIAMERLSGETLASRISREGFPALPVILDIAEQVAAALDYAHAHDVVHHDIKPENIMLGDGWQQIKVNDFGIAERRRAEDSANQPRTEIGGTPSYMAPEHLRGEPTDARSDLFSLGVMLYWLVCGKLPWPPTDDMRQLLRQRRHVRRPRIQPRDPSAPSILTDLVHTLLASRPQDRYQRGAEVVEDLRLARREYERLYDKPLATRIVSLRLRWSGILGIVVSLTLLIGLAAIYAKQHAAVTGLALDFGSSMSRMVANESAEDLLLGDQAATRALVESIARNQQIRYLAITDRHGHIIASTQPAQINGKLAALEGPQNGLRNGDIQSYRTDPGSAADQGQMLLFDAPIQYQSATVGHLRLGISDAPLRAAQKITLWVIIAVLLVTLVAAVGSIYWLLRRLMTMLDLLGNAMLRVARGDFRHRIRLARRDELGRVFAAFNLMNGALQDRDARPRGTPDDASPDDVNQPTRILPRPDQDEDPSPLA
ncbi:MAG: protein kinase [Pseudomonadota bacterium]|nr:protein kinase [Pseudomonadota bacterium]